MIFRVSLLLQLHNNYNYYIYELYTEMYTFIFVNVVACRLCVMVMNAHAYQAYTNPYYYFYILKFNEKI